MYNYTSLYTQVLGKPAVNLKLSHFKQILKSCRGGLSMLIHRMPGDRRPHKVPSSLPQTFSPPRGGKEGDHRSLGDFISPASSSYQAPGTPGSNLSETTGYYSTQSTSLPSVCSAAISPGTPDIKASGTGLPGFGRYMSPSLNLKSAPSQTSTSQHSGYETDQISFDTSSHFCDGSVSSSMTNNNNHPYSSRLGDTCSPHPRSLYLGYGSRTRMSSQSSYGGSSQLSSSVLSPKSDAMTSNSSRFGYSNSRNNSHHPPPLSPFSVPRNSYSVDRLESHAPRRTSADSHVIPLGSSLNGPHSLSSSNVYRMELGKRTNV